MASEYGTVWFLGESSQANDNDSDGKAKKKKKNQKLARVRPAWRLGFPPKTQVNCRAIGTAARTRGRRVPHGASCAFTDAASTPGVPTGARSRGRAATESKRLLGNTQAPRPTHNPAARLPPRRGGHIPAGGCNPPGSNLRVPRENFTGGWKGCEGTTACFSPSDLTSFPPPRHKPRTHRTTEPTHSRAASMTGPAGAGGASAGRGPYVAGAGGPCSSPRRGGTGRPGPSAPAFPRSFPRRGPGSRAGEGGGDDLPRRLPPLSGVSRRR